MGGGGFKKGGFKKIGFKLVFVLVVGVSGLLVDMKIVIVFKFEVIGFSSVLVLKSEFVESDIEDEGYEVYDLWKFIDWVFFF